MADTLLPSDPNLSLPARRTVRRTWRDGIFSDSDRDIAEETPVALVYNGSTEAVMMATPMDLEDFAVGFSLTDGLIETTGDIKRLDILSGSQGIETRMWLTTERADLVAARRRLRTGPTGCGLCGIESLEAAIKSPKPLTADLTVTGGDILTAVARLDTEQDLGRITRATHAAAFWDPVNDSFVTREDVGRHNALDKLAGAMARQAIAGHQGVIVLSSRVSVEMVQKAVAIGTPILIAVSAPTALAIRTAHEANLTLVAVARRDGFEVFTHPQRIRR